MTEFVNALFYAMCTLFGVFVGLPILVYVVVKTATVANLMGRRRFEELDQKEKEAASNVKK